MGAAAKGAILIRMGDETTAAASFEELYRSSHPAMVRLAYLITGSHHAAEEISHDCFLAMQPRWGTIADPAAYLRQAVVNRSRSHLRRLRTVRNAPAEQPPVAFPEEIDETWQLIQQLPERRRTALILHYYLDLPVGEIATLMKTRPGTVKSLLHRGRESLREELQ
jgi:RNA polymerase sigma factor (sigma-70 family)